MFWSILGSYHCIIHFSIPPRLVSNTSWGCFNLYFRHFVFGRQNRKFRVRERGRDKEDFCTITCYAVCVSWSVLLQLSFWEDEIEAADFWLEV